MTRRLLAVAFVLLSARAWADHVNTYAAGDTVNCDFTTATSVATVLTGTPGVTIYKDGGTSSSTSGVTLTASRASIVGWNHVAIDTSADGTFFATGHYYDAVITAGTVGGASVVGFEVCSWRLGVVQTGDSYARLGAPSGASIDADILTRLASSSYTAPPSAASVSTAVWSDMLATYTTAGTTGKKLGDIPTSGGGASAADVWSYSDRRLTSFGFSGTSLTIQSPVSGHDLSIVPGAAYSQSPHGAGVPFTVGSSPDLTNGTVRLVISGGGTAIVGTTCAVSGAGTSTQSVTCDLTAAQTALLATPNTTGAYKYQLNVTYAADNPTQPIPLTHGNVNTLYTYAP